jgi:hypothetical protein
VSPFNDDKRPWCMLPLRMASLYRFLEIARLFKTQSNRNRNAAKSQEPIRLIMQNDASRSF